MADYQALVLAAGLSRRMGRPKLAREWEGRPVLAWTVERIRRLLPDVGLVVVAPPSGPVLELARTLPVRTVINPTPEAGVGRSLAVGLGALAAAAALVFLGDEPDVSAAGVARVLEVSAAPDLDVVLPRYRGVPGHPVYVSRALWPELLQLTGDRGVRAVLDAWPPGRWRDVDVDDDAVADLDTEADWTAWTQRRRRAGAEEHGDA